MSSLNDITAVNRLLFNNRSVQANKYNEVVQRVAIEIGRSRGRPLDAVEMADVNARVNQLQTPAEQVRNDRSVKRVGQLARNHGQILDYAS